MDLLDLVGTKTIDYFASIGTEELSGQSLLHWIEALQIVGEVNFTKGEYDQSYQTFEQSAAVLSTALDTGPEAVILLEKQMLNNYWLGYINVIKKQHQMADHYFQQYLQSAKQLSEKEPEEQKWQLELSYALNNLGTLSLETQQLVMAHQYFSDSIAIKQGLLDKDPKNQRLLADLADSVSWLGKVKQKEGDLKGTFQVNQQSLQLSRQLLRINLGKPQWQHRLSIALHRVALSHYDFAQLADSKVLIEESLILMESLVTNDVDNYNYKRQLINNYLLMAKINRHQNDLDKSLFYIQKGQRLVDVFKTQLKFNKKIAHYSVQLIVEQTHIMAAHQQHQLALNSLNNADIIWQDYLQHSTGAEMDETSLMSLA